LLKRNGDYISNRNKTRYCRFLDGDYSDYPDELTQLIAPILETILILLLAQSGSFKRKNSMTPQQIFGNWLATTLMKIFNATFTDLGPLEL
jgi:hypothetical protein